MRTLWVLLGVYALAGCGRIGLGDDGGDDVVVGPRLTIRMTGTGAGTIVGPDAIQCSSTCTIDVVPGSTVSLRSAAATESWFAGWAGPCGGNFGCDVVIPAGSVDEIVVDAEFAPLPNRAFVTGSVYTGAIGGLAAADASCATAAADAGLDGTFIAFLSDTTSDILTRLAGSRGWIRTDGAPVADLATDFAGGLIAFPIRMDEFGNDLGSLSVMTGSEAGACTGLTCMDWASADPMLDVSSSASSWGSIFATGSGTNTCDQVQHLICVETGRNVPVAPKPDTGRVAFLSTNLYVPGGGLAAADALCASDASDAGQPGTFLAALATTTTAIADRFTPGQVWRRTDAIRLAPPGELFDTDFLDVTVELDINGGLQLVDYWTGSARWNTVADPSENCSDWTTSDMTVDAIAGWTGSTDMTGGGKHEDCDVGLRLLCLEE
jgi:hypothetical protein